MRIGLLVDSACERIEKGLLSPYVCVTFAGDPATIAQLPGFDRLEATARDHDIELITTIMSITGAVNVGPGSVGLALAAPPHTFE